MDLSVNVSENPREINDQRNDRNVVKFHIDDSRIVRPTQPAEICTERNRYKRTVNDDTDTLKWFREHTRPRYGITDCQFIYISISVCRSCSSFLFPGLIPMTIFYLHLTFPHRFLSFLITVGNYS